MLHFYIRILLVQRRQQHLDKVTLLGSLAVLLLLLPLLHLLR